VLMLLIVRITPFTSYSAALQQLHDREARNSRLLRG
jgi:hypothetical protein